MAGENICYYYNICPMKIFYEEGKIERFWVENYCFKGGENCKRKEMEEKGIPHPDNMLPDGKIDPNLK